MLIFVKGPYLDRIAAGQKTTTIRPWRTCTLAAGDTLSFNGKLRVTLTAVEHRRFGDLDDQDAVADGFRSRAALRAAFAKHYPHVTRDALVWVLRFPAYGAGPAAHLPAL